MVTAVAPSRTRPFQPIQLMPAPEHLQIPPEVETHKIARPCCPRCGGSLFLEKEIVGASRTVYYWDCSLSCNREYDLNLVQRVKRVIGVNSATCALAGR